MNLAEIRMRLELAAKNKPALKKLLSGDIRTTEDLDEIAEATAELGMFELSFLVRSLASGETLAEEGLAKLAFYVSSVGEAEVVDQFIGACEKRDPELAALLRTFGKIAR